LVLFSSIFLNETYDNLVLFSYIIVFLFLNDL